MTMFINCWYVLFFSSSIIVFVSCQQKRTFRKATLLTLHFLTAKQRRIANTKITWSVLNERESCSCVIDSCSLRILPQMPKLLIRVDETVRAYRDRTARCSDIRMCHDDGNTEVLGEICLRGEACTMKYAIYSKLKYVCIKSVLQAY